MTGVLLQEMEQHPLQRGRLRTVPPRTGNPNRRQLATCDHGSGMHALRAQRADLRGVNLTDVVGLTTEQLANAGLDAGTRLPDGVVRPSPTR